MSTFKSVNVEDLKKIVMKSPSKNCLLDPLPTWLLKKHLPAIMPILCQIVNVSLETGQFPSDLLKAIMSTVLKKSSLDRQQLGSYRPVSNLSYLGKLIKRVVTSLRILLIPTILGSRCSLLTVVCTARRQPVSLFGTNSSLIEKKLCSLL